MAFTTWADLKTQLLDDIASGRWRVSDYEVASPGGSRRRKFTSLAELVEFLKFVETRADLESGSAVTRTYAKHVSSGRFGK